MDVNKEVLKGHVDMILLLVLENKDMYGYELSKAIQIKSNRQFELKEGTLYLALKRLEKNDFIKSYWNDEETSGGGRRKYFCITQNGISELKKKKTEWEFIQFIINQFL